MAETEPFLAQRNSLGLDVQIKLVEGHVLKFVTKRKKSDEKYSIDILSLQPKSKEKDYVAWKWLIACIVSFLIGILTLIVLPEYLGDNKDLYLGIILTSIMSISLWYFILFRKRSSSKRIFYSRIAHTPVIELTSNKPSKEVFSRFINTVEQRIIKYQAHMNIPEKKQLTGEMKMLRRLSDEGIISKKSYSLAKAKLFTGLAN